MNKKLIEIAIKAGEVAIVGFIGALAAKMGEKTGDIIMKKAAH